MQFRKIFIFNRVRDSDRVREKKSSAYSLLFFSLPTALFNGKKNHTKVQLELQGTFSSHIMLSKHFIQPYLKGTSDTMEVCLSRVKKLIGLTVGERKARSDIIFSDCCMTITNKDDSADGETHPSHTHCPHSSSEPFSPPAATGSLNGGSIYCCGVQKLLCVCRK